jgi:hypothetical protein
MWLLPTEPGPAVEQTTGAEDQLTLRVAIGIRVAVPVAVRVSVSVGIAVVFGVRVAIRVSISIAVGVAVHVTVTVDIGIDITIDIVVGIGIPVSVGVSVPVGPHGNAVEPDGLESTETEALGLAVGLDAGPMSRAGHTVTRIPLRARAARETQEHGQHERHDHCRRPHRTSSRCVLRVYSTISLERQMTRGGAPR